MITSELNPLHHIRSEHANGPVSEKVPQIMDIFTTMVIAHLDSRPVSVMVIAGNFPHILGHDVC